MSENRLNIVAVENHPSPATDRRRQSSLRNQRKEAIQAKFERLWLIDPLQFDPFRNCRESERFERTFQLITEYFDPANKLIADLGCAAGAFSKRLAEGRARVHAVDVAGNALSRVKDFKLENIETYQECLPKTLLKDEAYDLVLSTEVIAYLQPDEYRLYFSELSRLLKADGSVVCSTAIDFHSEDALQRFANLAETEFKIEEWIFSYHALHIRFCNFFEIPAHFIRASQDSEYCQKSCKDKTKWSRYWWRLNTSRGGVIFWKSVNFFFQPILALLKRNRTLLLQMEKICKFFSDPSGISHAIFIGVRRPLVEVPEEMQPLEAKRKKSVWE